MILVGGAVDERMYCRRGERRNAFVMSAGLAVLAAAIVAFAAISARAAIGPEWLTTILGTIAIDFAASADATPAASSGTPGKSDAGVTFE